jgi:energy-coupling factor transporter ATP-binding protein EcfA2
MFLAESLTLTYPGERQALFSGLDIRLNKGEMLWLRGPNGCGKTSLLNCLSGVIPHHVKARLDGTLMLGGTDLGALPLNEKYRHLAYQMSDPDDQIFFPRIEKELSFALENAGLPEGDMRGRIALAAEAFGLAGFWLTEPSRLSRGQKKLLLLAVCAAQNTPLLLLDEPSAALSGESLAMVSAWLENYLAAGNMVVMAEHNPALAGLATQILDLS